MLHCEHEDADDNDNVGDHIKEKSHIARFPFFTFFPHFCLCLPFIIANADEDWLNGQNRKSKKLWCRAYVLLQSELVVGWWLRRLVLCANSKLPLYFVFSYIL